MISGGLQCDMIPVLHEGVHHEGVGAWVRVHATVTEKGLGSVPVSMHSPQSKVNTAALFSSQPSAGSPQAWARDHTPRPHTRTHALTHTQKTAQTSLQILPHTRIRSDHTTPTRGPSHATLLSCHSASRMHACECAKASFVCVYSRAFLRLGGSDKNTPGSGVRTEQN